MADWRAFISRWTDNNMGADRERLQVTVHERHPRIDISIHSPERARHVRLSTSLSREEAEGLVVEALEQVRAALRRVN